MSFVCLLLQRHFGFSSTGILFLPLSAAGVLISSFTLSLSFHSSNPSLFHLLCTLFSERTFGDIIHTLEIPADWAMKLVIRKWCDGIDVGNEFRGFVCEGKLVALSQYNDGCFYHELVGNEVTPPSSIPMTQ